MATIKKNKKKKIIIAVIIVAIIAVAATAAYFAAVESSIPSVSLYSVGTSDIYETVSATGQVSSGAVKEYKVGAVATVKEVKVKVGDVVKKGDLLATFDTSGFDSQITQMQASYNQAKASYNEAVASQKEAKKNLADVQKKIAELEKENKKLKKDASKTTTAKASSTTRPSAALPNLPEIGNPSDSITLPSGVSPELPSIDINDMNAVMAAASSSDSKLAANELMLAAYYAQEKLYSSLASDSLVSSKKELMNTTKNALNSLQDAQQEMAAGWTAAFDGTITECNIFPGEQTSLLANGIVLQNMNNMVVSISLGEYDIHKVKVDMPARIKTAYGEYTGKVISKAPVASGGSSSSLIDSVGSSMGISGLSSLTQAGAGVEVQIAVDNPDEYIIIGFDADVEIAVGEHLGITTVPSNAMVLDKTGSYVFVYNEETKTVTKTLIETGAASVSDYEVLSGVKIGDKIVLAPQSTFEDSFEARIKEDA